MQAEYHTKGLVAQLQFGGYALLCFLLPFGEWISISVILLAATVFLTQPPALSWQRIKAKPIIFWFISGYLVFLLGQLYSDNLAFGWRDLEYKLSILVMPLIVGASHRLESRQLNALFFLFIIACLLAIFLSYIYGLFTVPPGNVPVYTDLSFFQHPAYFSLYLNFGFILIIQLLSSPENNRFQRILLLFAFGVFFIFNFLLSSKMGLITSMLVMGGLAWFLLRNKAWWLRLTLTCAILISMFGLTRVVPGLTNRIDNATAVVNKSQIEAEATESSQIRILVWEQAFQIIKEHPVIGVGTGDIKDELINKYQAAGITKAAKQRLNPHNQYIQITATIGLLGLLVWSLIWWLPLQIAWRRRDFLYIFFLIMLLINLLTESMLENQAGVVYYTFFNALLFLHSPAEKALKT